MDERYLSAVRRRLNKQVRDRGIRMADKIDISRFLPESPKSGEDAKMAFWLLQAREDFLGWIESLPLAHELDHSEYLQMFYEELS